MYQNLRPEVAPQVRLERTTLRLTAECSAIELLRNIQLEKLSFLQPFGIRRRPTLPGRFQPSTISVWRLNFCVRYGNRWDPPAIVTGNRIHLSSEYLRTLKTTQEKLTMSSTNFVSLLDQALDLLVSAHCVCYHTSMSDLSTSSSLRGLTCLCSGSLILQGGFTLRCLQRLSRPHFASLLCPWQNNSFTRGASIPVLSY